MSDQPVVKTTLDDIRVFCVDFGLPVLIIVILALLMAFGIDSEVKTLLAATVGWIINSGIRRRGTK
mgnify:CR=1 FL=1